MERNIIEEQIEYYRARAGEYDQSLGIGTSSATGGDLNERDDLAEIAQIVRSMGSFNDVLELACGTGIWTQELVKIAASVTALDASPEMLALNADKVADPRVTYAQADLFAWEPDREYDLVFFAFWLSHVPPDLLDSFLDNACNAVRPGGSICIIDQRANFDTEPLTTEGGIYSHRTVQDGRSFTIIKVIYDLGDLAEKLKSRGFEVEVREVGGFFFYILAIR
jgi:demethylmenaquinone methyltransferase/2-methoxy-6-polyprenyl-1,4-benzoquinol methylase